MLHLGLETTVFINYPVVFNKGEITEKNYWSYVPGLKVRSTRLFGRHKFRSGLCRLEQPASIKVSEFHEQCVVIFQVPVIGIRIACVVFIPG